MNSAQRVLMVAAALAAALVSATPEIAAARSLKLGGGCTYDRPSRLPYWTVSGAWDGSELLLVDAAANEVIRYSADGRALGTLKGLDSRALGPVQPSQIASVEGDMVLQLTGGRFVRLGPDRLVQKQQEVHRDSRTPGGHIDAVRLWTVAGEDIVLCGDVERPQNRWQIGFIRAPLGELGRFEVLAEFDGPDDPAELFCRLGYPYVASLGDTAYFLVMEETPELYAAEPRQAPRRLKEVRLPPRPDLPALVSPEDFPTVFRAVERSPMVAGLLASEGRLYVLIREPRIAGTQWTLHELDPGSGREIGHAVVPSVADHLLVVPGPWAWAFVEKGEVREMGVQDVAGVLRVPAANVRAIQSAGDEADLCGRGPRLQGIAAARH